MTELERKLNRQKFLNGELNSSDETIDNIIKSPSLIKYPIDEKEPTKDSELEFKLAKRRSSLENYKVQESELQGLIFDCDGTLVDTMPVYYESWRKLCAKYGLSLTKKEFYSYAGIPVPDILAKVLASSGKTGQFDENKLIKEKASYASESIKSVGTPAIKVVVDIVKKYHGKLPMAVASSGMREHVLESLRTNDLEKYFDAIITAESVTNPKPAPDIFLLAAKTIGCDPTKCRGYEDGDVGLQALKAAGMEVIDVKLFDGYPNPKYDNITKNDENNENYHSGSQFEDNSIKEPSLLWKVIKSVLFILIIMKIGEYLLQEAIKDEALSQD